MEFLLRRQNIILDGNMQGAQTRGWEKCKKMPHIYVTSTHQKKLSKPKIVSNNEAVIYMRNNRHTIASKTITQNTETHAQLTTSAAQVATSSTHSTSHDHRACMDRTEPQNLHNNTAVSAQHPNRRPPCSQSYLLPSLLRHQIGSQHHS